MPIQRKGKNNNAHSVEEEKCRVYDTTSSQLCVKIYLGIAARILESECEPIHGTFIRICFTASDKLYSNYVVLNRFLQRRKMKCKKY